MRSREMVREVRFLPWRVWVGDRFSLEWPVPHCRRSPLSSMATAKFLSSLRSRRSTPSKNGIRRGVLMNSSSESGAATRPELEPHA